MSVSLVVLAAGFGRRFGGPKQLEPVGPEAEPLFALTARAAFDGGFDRVVLVVRSALVDQVEPLVARHLAGRPIELVLQDRAGPSRSHPWGTAHAVVACAPLLDGAVGVCNADDAYDHDDVVRLGREVACLAPREALVVTYRLDDTLSPNGPVNRAVCRCDAHGGVVELRECFGLRRAGDQAVDGAGRAHPLDAPVSMNLLGLGAAVPGLLAQRFVTFAADHGGDEIEAVLPDELAALAAARAVTIRSIAATGPWAGLTHRGDLEALRRRFREPGRHG